MGEGIGFFDVVGGENDCMFGVGFFIYDLLEMVMSFNVQVGCWFVEDKYIGFRQYCEGEMKLLLLIF